jgi:hypothetical protein
MAFNIFLSHSNNDIQSASAISQYFKRMPNVDVFLAEENVVAGNLADGITSRIKACDIFMVLYSKNSHNSQYVQNEIGVAKGTGKDMLILSLDDTKPTAMLQGYTYYPLYSPDVANLPTIYKYIKQKEKEKASVELLIIGGAALLGFVYLLLKNE